MTTQQNTRFDLASKQAFVCDLDGTLFMGKTPIGPAVRFVVEHARDYDFYFLTNNTSKTPETYLAKLGGVGIATDEAHILTPLDTLESYVRERRYTSVYLVANQVVLLYLQRRLPRVKFEFAPGRNQLVALTYDTELTYEKLRHVSALLNADPGLDYVATHGDACCPSEEGPVPDVGGLIQLVKTTNGREPGRVFGKPSPTLLAAVLQRFARSGIAVVGDRLYTDKAMADAAGVDFVCVLSGETTRASLAAYRGTPPSLVLETLGEIA